MTTVIVVPVRVIVPLPRSAAAATRMPLLAAAAVSVPAPERVAARERSVLAVTVTLPAPPRVADWARRVCAVAPCKLCMSLCVTVVEIGGARVPKKSTSVRLSDEGRKLLEAVAVKLGISQAGVIELALRVLAKREEVQS